MRIEKMSSLADATADGCYPFTCCCCRRTFLGRCDAHELAGSGVSLVPPDMAFESGSQPMKQQTK